MRLSKRQLKRIIREEYSRLKRRGLIKEDLRGTLPMASGLEDHEVEEMSAEFFVDQLMAKEYATGIYDNVGALQGDGAAYEEIMLDAMDQFPELAEEEFELIWNQAGFVDQT